MGSWVPGTREPTGGGVGGMLESRGAGGWAISRTFAFFADSAERGPELHADGRAGGRAHVLDAQNPHPPQKCAHLRPPELRKGNAKNETSFSQEMA